KIWCCAALVPVRRHIENTSYITPEKEFIKVPVEENRRKQWLAAASRENISTKTTVCCLRRPF
ncbi:unnamed protein product, partial [Callosobruchus maculatus]